MDGILSLSPKIDKSNRIEGISLEKQEIEGDEKVEKQAFHHHFKLHSQNDSVFTN